MVHIKKKKILKQKGTDGDTETPGRRRPIPSSRCRGSAGSSEILQKKVMSCACKLCKGLVLQGLFSRVSWGRGENATWGQRASLHWVLHSPMENWLHYHYKSLNRPVPSPRASDWGADFRSPARFLAPFWRVNSGKSIQQPPLPGRLWTCLQMGQRVPSLPLLI